MRPRFICQVIEDTDDMVRVHLVADDGHNKADVFVNAPKDWFGGELPRQGNHYFVEFVDLSLKAARSYYFSTTEQLK